MTDPIIGVKDKVAYSAGYLKSIGVQSGGMPEMRGVVLSEIQKEPGFRLLEIDWGRGLKSMVNEKNLTLVSRIAIDSARHT